MLGVYLGLLANNWNNQKEENKQTEKALENLSQEVKYNHITTEESLDYFKQLRDTIHMLDNRNTLPSSFSFWKGLNPPLFKNASFRATFLSGVMSKLDMDLLEKLTGVYELQEDIELQSNNYTQSITNKIGEETFTNEKFLIILENYAHDQISAQEQLVKELENLKQTIHEKSEH